MLPSAAADVEFQDPDISAGMGTYEEAIAFLLGDGGAVGVALAANPAAVTSGGRNWRHNPVYHPDLNDQMQAIDVNKDAFCSCSGR